jgi:pyridinium-3,5-bisthiocarboxylic acid mononucleotide nickel chelatase
MKIIYCDCQNGFSSNSFLAALLAAGLPLPVLNERYNQLAFTQTVIAHTQTISKSVSAPLVLSFEGRTNFPEKSGATDRLFTWQDIINLFEFSQLPAAVNENCLKVLERLATAIPQSFDILSQKSDFLKPAVSQMILELVGLTSGLEFFKTKHFFCSPVPLESNADPIIINLYRQGRVKVIPSPSSFNRATPFGAAILADLAVSETPSMTIETSGCGADSSGSSDFMDVNILIGEVEVKQEVDDSYVMLETNLDDMPGLAFSSLQKLLMLAGAWDVYFTPIQMKKNRPGILLNAFTTRSNESRLANLILSETSTFGIRVYPVSKYMAERNLSSVDTMYGKIRVKIKILDGIAVQGWPEYEDCAVQAQKNKVPFLQVYQAAQTAAQNLLQ